MAGRSKPLFQKDDHVGEGLNLKRWVVVRKVGEGQFAEVYEVKDTLKQDKRCALKIDRTSDVKTLKQEHKVLRRLQACPQVVRLQEAGTHEDRFFIVMDLLGMNVADMRRSCTTEGRWDAGTMVAIGRHMLAALEGMHRAGFIHRDVKPANYAITPRHASVKEGAWHVIDFGLARRFVDEEGGVLAQREEAAFRGSTSYASVNAHRQQDLGRRDDLWSWLYVLVEMLDGTLPWRCETADRDAASFRAQVARQKEDCIAHPDRLTSTVPLPGGLRQISDYLAQLPFEQEPDYEWLRSRLDAVEADTPPSQRPASSGQSALTWGDGSMMPAASYGGLGPTPTQSFLDLDGAPALAGFIPDTPLSPPASDPHATAFLPLAQPPALGGLGNGVEPLIPDTPLSPSEEDPGLRMPPLAGLPGSTPSPPLPNGTAPAAAGRADQPLLQASAPASPLRRDAGAEAGPRLADDQRHFSRERDRHRHDRDAPASRECDRERSRDGGYEREHELDTDRNRQRSRDRDRGYSQERDYDRWDGSRDRRRERDDRQREGSGRRDWESDGGRDRDRDRGRKREGSREDERYSKRSRYADDGRDSADPYERNRVPRKQVAERPPANGRARATPERAAPKRDLQRERYLDVLQFVDKIDQGNVSSLGADIRGKLEQAAPVETIALIAWIIDHIVGNTDAKDFDQIEKVARWLDDMSGFMAENSKRLWNKMRKR